MLLTIRGGVVPSPGAMLLKVIRAMLGVVLMSTVPGLKVLLRTGVEVLPVNPVRAMKALRVAKSARIAIVAASFRTVISLHFPRRETLAAATVINGL